jgi:hypothetical protein
VWKRLRLLTLIVLTVLLAVATYPTWGNLVIQEGSNDIDYDKTFIALLATNNATDFVLTARVSVAEAFEQGRSPSDTHYDQLFLEQHPAGGLTDSPKPQPALMFFSGAVRNWASGCYPGYGDREELQFNDLPQIYKDILGPDNADGRYIYMLHAGGSCDVPANELWTDQDPSLIVRPPRLTAGLAAQPDLQSQVRDNQFCTEMAISYGIQMTLDYSYPTPSELTEGLIAWRTCNTRERLEQQDISMAKPPPAIARFTDLHETVRVNRNTFFAGVFAGVLGALAIEIFNVTFDVAEHWSARRRTRRDEQEQRPEPTPDPPPAPDDEVDRDQLPLF